MEKKNKTQIELLEEINSIMLEMNDGLWRLLAVMRMFVYGKTTLSEGSKVRQELIDYIKKNKGATLSEAIRSVCYIPEVPDNVEEIAEPTEENKALEDAEIEEAKKEPAVDSVIEGMEAMQVHDGLKPDMDALKKYAIKLCQEGKKQLVQEMLSNYEVERVSKIKSEEIVSAFAFLRLRDA